MNNILVAKKNLLNALREKDFIIHKYEAFSTNSVYLKLDYGVSNTIRISDHKGKKHLKYRYNVLKGYSHKKVLGDPLQYFYPINSFSGLASLILENKERKQNWFGLKNYFKYMQDRKLNRDFNKGFWSSAERVN